jgi:hypothetical protein
MTMPVNGDNVTFVPGGAPTTSTTANTTPPIVIQNQLPEGQYFTADQLEAARQQEKDKLYGRLQDQEGKLQAFQSQLEELNRDKETREAEAKRLTDEAAAARRAEEESKLSAQELVKAREAELRQQQEAFQSQMELKLATMQKEQEFLQLQSYTQRRVAELIAADEVIPDLVEFIGGNTVDEVEASITKVKEKTANIVKGAATLTAPGMPNGVSPTGGPSGLLDGISGSREFTPQEIAGMSMEQYRAYREQRGLDRAGNNRGMFS